MKNMNVPTWFLKKIPKLSMIPCEELPRKFLITGGENAGKTQLINSLYKKMNFIDYPEMVFAYKKSKEGNLKFNQMLPPENTFGAPEQVAMSGFYAGDLRNLRFHMKEYPPDISYSKMFAKEKEFGIMDISGERVAPFEKKDKFYKIAESELKKSSNVVFIDELMEDEFMTNDLKNRIISLMDDPGKIVIASMKNTKKFEEFGFLDYIKQQKNLETFDMDTIKDPKKVEALILK